MNRRTIAILGCGFPQLGLLRAACEMGLEVIGLDRNPEAVGVPLVHSLELISTGDADAVQAVMERRGIAALTTTGSELALTTAATVVHRMNLPFYADPETVHRCQDKGEMRAAYQAAGLRVPQFLHAHRWVEIQKFTEQLGPPWVIKPAMGWGQRGVSRVEDHAALESAFLLADAMSTGGAGVVIEEFLVGNELSINGWIEDGNLVAYAVTDREVFAGDRPLGVMQSEVTPSRLSSVQVEAGIEAARRAARALGLRRGPCYTQVCVSRNEAVVFETAARCGGGFDADVARLVSGVDLYRRLLGIALGDVALENEGVRSKRYGAALVRFLAPPVGEVVCVEGVEEVREMQGVLDAVVYAKPGQQLAGLVNAASRSGHLLCVGASRQEAVARADAAEKQLRIVCHP